MSTWTALLMQLWREMVHGPEKLMIIMPAMRL
jgi:hypothetical protein